MYKLYRLLTSACSPLAPLYLSYRKNIGKENERSISEKSVNSFSAKPLPEKSKLLWLHGASIGEAQSSLILIESILDNYPELNVIVTTGTLTSANLMEKRLPERAFHQYCPLDIPGYINKFLDHWQPNFALWMESELWPNTLHELKKRNIPAILVNAHMSKNSFKNWSYLPSFSKEILSNFNKILCQSESDKQYFNALGASNTVVTNNLKYSAAPLTYNHNDLNSLKQTTRNRPLWLYASTHDGEEELACRVHEKLKKTFPDLLTIIVPRHPERRNEIAMACSAFSLKLSFRGENKNLPLENDDIYIADTLGELGLFYTLSPIALIGRSMSNDGGGGHNPIEAAQLGCAVLHGPDIKNLKDIFTQMADKKACIEIKNEQYLEKNLQTLLSNNTLCTDLQQKALSFAQNKTNVVNQVMDEISDQLKNEIG